MYYIQCTVPLYVTCNHRFWLKLWFTRACAYRNLGNFCTYIFRISNFRGSKFRTHGSKISTVWNLLSFENMAKAREQLPENHLRVKEVKNTHLLSQIDPLLRFYLASTCFRLLHIVATCLIFLFFQMFEYSKFPISEQKRFVRNIVLIEFFPNYGIS